MPGERRLEGPELQTLEEGDDTPEGDRAALGELAQGQLEEEEGQAREHEVEEVGDEEGSWW